MKIFKFGGTSVATPERIRAVVEIVGEARREGSVVVVVSAFGGMTDALLGVAQMASSRDEAYRAALAAIQQRHRDAAHALAADWDLRELESRLHTIHRELEQLVDGVFMVREASHRTLDRVLGVGEAVSAACVAAALRSAGIASVDADARGFIVTDAEFGGARVQERETHEKIRTHFEAAAPKAVQVVTGFVAATANGEATTLGRGGSDYTASILGAALGAEAVEIWTDVDGVLSADPRIVHDAVMADHLSYDELMELSHFGAKVIYPPSVHPTRARAIPLRIRNTFAPENMGTLVTAGAEAAGGEAANAVRAAGQTVSAVRGIASIPRVDLLRLEGDGMIGVPGIAGRLFGALARHGVSVILISQASSEHSICFAVDPAATERAARGVEGEFQAERRAGLIEELVIERDLAVVAVVGAGMRDRTGVSGRLFDVLGRHAINIRAIAQGSSELNISLVVSAADEHRTIRTIHDTFFVSGERTVDLFLAGVGRVGRELLTQLEAQAATLARSQHVRLRLAGVAISRGALLDETGIPVDQAEALARASEDLVSLDEMAAVASRDRGRDRIWIDCTAGDEVPAHYDAMLASGAAVITANKLRLASSLLDWRELTKASRPRLYHETTVGAALPVIGTLQDLVATGDRVRRIEGVLSGTLAYLFGQLADGVAFSDAVRAAHDLGYTEPDPREDLGGRDVARKLLILSRLAGWELEPEDVQVDPLLGDDWSDLSMDDFWARLPELNDDWRGRMDAARQSGKSLVYLAILDDDGARLGARDVEASHPAVGSGTDNLVAFTTDRYHETPLVVRGPGAGPEVTASGVFADILRAIAEGDAQ